MASINRSQLLFVILAVTVVAVLAGCEQEREDATLTDGLLVLSGDVGSVRLTVREDDGERSRGIELPDSGTSWVSAGSANVLLATLVDGRTYVSDPLGEDDPTWRLVEPVTLTDQAPEPPLFYGTWDPPGGAYAQLGADFSEGGGMRAVIVDPGLDQAVEVPMNQSRPVAAPPAWIDDDRLILISATSEGTEAVIVDSASQGYEPGPSGVQLVATSADAATAAVWRGPGQGVEIQSTTSWLADEPADVRSILRTVPRCRRCSRSTPTGSASRSCGPMRRARRPGLPFTRPLRSGRGWPRSTWARQTRRRWPGFAEGVRGFGHAEARRSAGPAGSGLPGPAGPAAQAVTGCPAEKIDTCDSSGSMTPKTFWSVSRWTHEPQLSK